MILPKSTERFNFKGFTLVELLVVMAIISILATVILGGFRASQRRAKDTKRKSDLQQIAKALEMFYNDHERYPAASADGKILACEYIETAPDTSGECDWGSSDISDGNTLYFRQVPDDLSNNNYYYRTVDSYRGYQLYTHLENPEDTSCIKPDCLTSNQPVPPPVCGDDICNFAITSSNTTPTDN